MRVFSADGEVRDVDLTPTLQTKLFSRLDDPGLFAAAHIGEVTGGLEWTDDIGLDPDVIYAALQPNPRAARIRILTPAWDPMMSPQSPWAGAGDQGDNTGPGSRKGSE